MIEASLVKALRDKTGAGMMECKRALVETGGDLEKAKGYLQRYDELAPSDHPSRAAYKELQAKFAAAKP